MTSDADAVHDVTPHRLEEGCVVRALHQFSKDFAPKRVVVPTVEKAEHGSPPHGKAVSNKHFLGASIHDALVRVR